MCLSALFEICWFKFCVGSICRERSLNFTKRVWKRWRADSVSASSLFRRGRTRAYFGPSPLAAVKHLVSMNMREWMKIRKAMNERHFRNPFSSSDKQVPLWNTIRGEYNSFVLVLSGRIGCKSKKTSAVSERAAQCIRFVFHCICWLFIPQLFSSCPFMHLCEDTAADIGERRTSSLKGT